MTIGAVLALIVLVWLGNWQWEKYTSGMAEVDAPAPPFESITVSVEGGAGDPLLAQQVYGLVDGEPVWRRYVPGRINGDGELVLLAWNATGGPGPVPLAITGLGTRTQDARIFERIEERGVFSSPDEPENGIWYVFDGPAMLRAFGYDKETVRVVEPVELEILLADDASRKRVTSNPYATPVRANELPPQRHLGYALTWWGLAAALLGVYLAFHAARGRLRFRTVR